MNFTVVIVLARLWWAFVLRGILAIAFGVVALLVPEIALVALAAVFAVWAITDGVTQLIAAWRMRGQPQWWIGLIEGLIGLVAGIVAIIWFEIVPLALLVIVAAWSIVTGVLEIYAAIRLREQIRGELLLGLAGLLSIAFGVALLLFPGPGILGLLWLVAFFAIAFGATLFLLGLRLRRIHDQATRQDEYAERGI